MPGNRPLFHNQQWGPWKLDARRLCLIFCEQGRQRYEVDLSTIDSSAEMLDWILQVVKKPWATHEVVGELIQALDHIFRPQAMLCSGGGDKRIANPTEFLRQRIALLDEEGLR